LVSEDLGVPDSAVAFASSNFWDVAGAKSFGFWTRWVNRGKLPEEELSVAPDVTVPTLNGLVDALEELTASRG
jgi:2-haloacid dehalogenase